MKTGTALKAVQELGVSQTGLYLFYQLGLRSGWLARRTRAALARQSRIQPGALGQRLFTLPDSEQASALLPNESRYRLLEEAAQICSGVMRIFTHMTVPLVPQEVPPCGDWTRCRPEHLGQDVKFIWEPGRFAWVYTLGMAYLATGKEVYPQAFWEACDRFFKAHPPYSGWQWVSAQEVALRLISLVYASQVFAFSTTFTVKRHEQLARWIAIHAARIPPSLTYARSQNNNHLLSEAAGLFSAGTVLPDHPDAEKWKRTGWSWLLRGLQTQISVDGSYIQHSTNYHRLMLQLVMWVELMRLSSSYEWPDRVMGCIRRSINWLVLLLDPFTGKVPNMGPNDGTYILPLTQMPFEDFRPTLQALYQQFFNVPLFSEDAWDDLGTWLGVKGIQGSAPPAAEKQQPKPPVIRHTQLESWAYLRAARFSGRPGHADQLHLDLWWQGQNIALDPGTYQYNAPPPWENSLTHTAVHNTLTLAGREQMQRASRFLYLDWAQAEVLSRGEGRINARHDGYRSLGLWHQRSVETTAWGWRITDQVLPVKSRQVTAPTHIVLHWLTQDWDWQIERDEGEVTLSLLSGVGTIRLRVYLPQQDTPEGQNLRPYLVRAGETLYSENLEQPTWQPTWGWFSPTYGLKTPALAFGVQLTCQPPVRLVSEWQLPTG